MGSGGELPVCPSPRGQRVGEGPMMGHCCLWCQRGNVAGTESQGLGLKVTPESLRTLSGRCDRSLHCFLLIRARSKTSELGLVPL